MSGNHSTEERVVHKLLGAAYQMSFSGDYELAAHTAKIATAYHDAHEDAFDSEGAVAPPTAAAPEAPSMADGGVVAAPPNAPVESSGPEQPDISLPGRGTASREALFAIARAMRHEQDWVDLRTIRDRSSMSQQAGSSLAGMASNYDDLVASRMGDNSRKEYRIRQEAYKQLQQSDDIGVLNGGDSE